MNGTNFKGAADTVVGIGANDIARRPRYQRPWPL